MCIYIYIIHLHRTHIILKQLLFWMRLIVINRLTALVFLHKIKNKCYWCPKPPLVFPFGLIYLFIIFFLTILANICSCFNPKLLFEISFDQSTSNYSLCSLYGLKFTFTKPAESMRYIFFFTAEIQ